MNSKNKPIYESVQKQRAPLKIVRAWVILILIIAFIVGGILLIRALTRTTTMTTTALPCYAHQDVTVFQDGVIYYDGNAIHYVEADGTIGWSLEVGAGATFSASKNHVIAWQGAMLYIMDAKGRTSYSDDRDHSLIQFARIGTRYAAEISGDERNPVLVIRDLQGNDLHTESTYFTGMMMLDVGFYGNSDQYLWALCYDLYNPSVSMVMHTFQVGQSETGSATIDEHLAYKVIYADDMLNVFTTQQMYTYNYRGVQNVDKTMLVYGWKYLDHYKPDRGSTQFLMAPTAQTDDVQTITELRVFSQTSDRRYTLPTACVGAAIENGRIYAFSSRYLYSGKSGSQRFVSHDMRLPNQREVTDFLGVTDNGYAIVASSDLVFSVSLPR